MKAQRLTVFLATNSYLLLSCRIDAVIVIARRRAKMKVGHAQWDTSNDLGDHMVEGDYKRVSTTDGVVLPWGSAIRPDHSPRDFGALK